MALNELDRKVSDGAHLHNAARALAAILAARHPEYTFVVEVRPREPGEGDAA